MSYFSKLFLFYFSLFVFFASPFNSKAEDKVLEPTENEQAEEKPQTSPSLSSLTEKIEEFRKIRETYESEIQDNLKKLELQIQITTLKNDYQSLKNQLNEEQLGNLNPFKLSDYLEKIKSLHEKSTQIKNRYLDFLKKTENIILELEEKKQNFVKFEKLKNPSFKSISINEIIDEIDVLKNKTEKTRQSQLKIYEASKDLFTDIASTKEKIENENIRIQSKIFEKNRSAVYEKNFWKSFDNQALSNVTLSIESLLQFESKNFNNHIQNYLIVLFAFLFLFILIKKLEKNFKFPLSPSSISLTISLILAYFIIKNPLPIIQLAIWIFLPFILLYLIKSYKFHTKTAPYLLRLFIIYSLIRIIEILNINLAFYRVFLICLSLFISIYAFIEYKKIKDWEAQTTLRRTSFIFVIVLFIITAISECLGFHNLSVLCVHGIIQSAFLFFALLFSRSIIYQILSSILDLPLFKKIKFIEYYQNQILNRLCKILQISTYLIAFFALPSIWGFYSNFYESFQNIGAFSFAIGSKEITLSMFLKAAIIIYLAYFFSFMLRIFLEKEIYPRKSIEYGVALSINSLVKYSLLIIATLLAFSAIGFDFKQLAIIAGALSVGIGFGLQNIFNNFVSGIILLFERPVKVGDILEINGELGEVEKVGLRSTVIRAYSQTQLIIPNSDFITQTVNNLTLTDAEFRLKIPVGVAYGSNTKLVKECLQKVIKEHPKVMEHPEPLVVFSGFGNSSLDFTILIWIKDVKERFIIQSDILFEVDQIFRNNSIEIPFPQRDLHLRSIDSKIMTHIKKKEN